MLAVALALGAAGCYGIADFIAGLAAKGRSAIGIALFAQGVGLLVLSALALLALGNQPSPADLLWGAAAGIAGPLSLILLYRGLADGLISIVAPVSGVCGIAFPVAVGMALGDRPAALALVGIGAAVVSVLLLGRSTPSDAAGAPSRKLVAPFWLAVAAGAAGGIFYIALERTAEQAGLWPLVAARVTGVSAMTLVGLLSGRLGNWTREVRGVPKVGFAGVLDALASGAYLLAVRGESMPIVVTLVCLYPAVTVFLARLFLAERLSRWQQAGVALAALAVVLITKA